MSGVFPHSGRFFSALPTLSVDETLWEKCRLGTSQTEKGALQEYVIIVLAIDSQSMRDEKTTKALNNGRCRYF